MSEQSEIKGFLPPGDERVSLLILCKIFKPLVL